MLSERQLEELLKVFDARFQGVVERYITLMGEHVRDIGNLTPSDVHRLKQLKNTNRNIATVKSEIAKAAGASLADIEQAFRTVAESDAAFARAMFASDYTPEVKASRIKTLSTPLERILKAQLRITAQEMKNLSQTTILSDTYKEAVDVAVQAVQSGLTDPQSAMRSALKRAAADGLKVRYASGYTRRLDTAVRQNVLDGVRALNQDVLRQLGKEYGADGVEISAHALCAEDHLPYQGKQFSNKDFNDIQNKLDRPFGLWNCKHTVFPIIMGVSQPAYTDTELAMYRSNSMAEITIGERTMSRYQWTQEQRRIETAIRQQKNIANAAKAAGDPVLRRNAQAVINRLTDEYDKISQAAGLSGDAQRMRVAGFRKVKTADELKKPEKYGIIHIGHARIMHGAKNISDVKIPMTVDSVREVMQHMNERAVYYDDVLIEVIDDADLLNHGLFGWTSPDGKTVQFYPLAFVNVENLSITIAHESKHIQQVREEGIRMDSKSLIERENDAYIFEDQWWSENGERIVKAYENSEWI